MRGAGSSSTKSDDTSTPRPIPAGAHNGAGGAEREAGRQPLDRAGNEQPRNRGGEHEDDCRDRQRARRGRGLTTADLLDQLVARAEEDELLAAMNHDFEALKADQPAWNRLEAERTAWEQALLDGLREA
jgi:hypothetical protein